MDTRDLKKHCTLRCVFFYPQPCIIFRKTVTRIFDRKIPCGIKKWGEYRQDNQSNNKNISFFIIKPGNDTSCRNSYRDPHEMEKLVHIKLIRCKRYQIGK